VAWWGFLKLLTNVSHTVTSAYNISTKTIWQTYFQKFQKSWRKYGQNYILCFSWIFDMLPIRNSVKNFPDEFRKCSTS
jgi:hypothetical protein